MTQRDLKSIVLEILSKNEVSLKNESKSYKSGFVRSGVENYLAEIFYKKMPDNQKEDFSLFFPSLISKDIRNLKADIDNYIN